MLELRRGFGWDEACLGLLIAAGSAAFASAQLGARPWAGLLVLPFFAVRVPRVPEGVRHGMTRVMAALLAATLVFGLLWALYPVLSEAVVRIVPRVLGLALIALALAFLAGSAAWRPSVPALPSALGLMTIAAYNPTAPIALPVAVGGVAVFFHLVGPRAWPRALRLGLVAALCVVLAAVIVRALPWAQPKVEAAAASVIDAGLLTSSGLNLDSTTRLGDVERLALSRKVALRVFTPRPQKLRARVFTRFDGLRWSAEAGPPARSLVEGPTPRPGSLGWLEALPGRSLLVPGATVPDDAVSTQVLQLEPTDKALPAPRGVRLVRVSGAGVAIGRDGLLVRPAVPPSRSTASSTIPGTTMEVSPFQRRSSCRLARIRASRSWRRGSPSGPRRRSACGGRWITWAGSAAIPWSRADSTPGSRSRSSCSTRSGGTASTSRARPPCS